MKSMFLTIVCSVFSLAHADDTENFYNQDLFQNYQKIYFHHIPKTAGITTRTFLEKNLSKPIYEVNTAANAYNLAFPVSSYDDSFKSELMTHLAHKDILSTSNVSFIYLKDFADANNIITILRDPLSRQLSHIRFYNFLSAQSEELATTIQNANQFLTHSCHTCNFQTLFLSSLDPYDTSISMQEHLESAKYNLKHKIAFFGLTEILEESLQLYFNKLNLGVSSPCEHLNATCHIRDLDFDFNYEQIKQNNWADVELYEFAKQLFFERFPDLKAVYEQKLAQLPLYVYGSKASSAATQNQEIHPEQQFNDLNETCVAIVEEISESIDETLNQAVTTAIETIENEVTQIEIETVEQIAKLVDEEFVDNQQNNQFETETQKNKATSLWDRIYSLFLSFF